MISKYMVKKSQLVFDNSSKLAYFDKFQLE